ncbi:GNAT family N-acetyltransferase [Terrarubrum flagellatum]|uniref:GNAT family N-acetyltransferase n=1 Tax=Terrirubrum flagellatum TaxID=2895980 RepID=UPI003144EE46
MSITIRVATPDDAEAVSVVLAASYPTLLAGAYEPEELKRALPAMIRPNPKLLASGTYHVAQTADGEIVGCGGWTHERPGTGEIEPGLGHIRHFAIRADWAGRGVGRALYRRCEEEARAAGVTEFESYSTLNGERFYAALGFRAIETINLPMGDSATFRSVRMRRAL